MGTNPESSPFLETRWWTLPNVTQGKQQVKRQRSMGVQQPKKLVSHPWAPAGDLEVT